MSSNGIRRNLSGQKFNMLTAIDYFISIRPSGSRVTRWNCKCDCGESTTVDSSDLIKGTTKSCGCQQHKNGVRHTFEDFTGRTFSRLTVISTYSVRDGNKTRIKCDCICSCGQTVSVLKQSLIAGHTLSCGCYQKDMRVASRMSDMEISFQFWNSVDKNGPIQPHTPELGQCWIWTGFCDRDGYGKMNVHREKRYCHRFAWEDKMGPIPEGMLICHKCDNPPCVRLDHLFIGTVADNNRDAHKKGRAAVGDNHGMRKHPEKAARGDRSARRKHPESYGVGEDHPTSKLTKEDVIDIKRRIADGESIRDISKDFTSVHRTNLYHIANGSSWRSVELTDG